MSKIFLLQSSDCASIANVIRQLGAIYGTPKVLFTDLDLDIGNKTFLQTIEGFEMIEAHIGRHFGERVISNAGVTAFDDGTILPSSLISASGQEAVRVAPIVGKDLIFIEYERDGATSLIVLVRSQAILNLPTKSAGYEEFLQAARKLALYYAEHYQEDVVLRDLIQAVVNAGVKSKQH